MPFFRGGQSIPPSLTHKQEDHYLTSPPVYTDDEVFRNEKPPSDSAAKRLLRKQSNKESGFRKLIRRHSSKSTREEVPHLPTPISQHLLPKNEEFRNHEEYNHHSVGSLDGLMTIDKRNGNPGSKVTFASHDKTIVDYDSKHSKKSSKPLKKSKSVSHKMPLHSVLKTPTRATSEEVVGITTSESRPLSYNAQQYLADVNGKTP